MGRPMKGESAYDYKRRIVLEGETLSNSKARLSSDEQLNRKPNRRSNRPSNRQSDGLSLGMGGRKSQWGNGKVGAQIGLLKKTASFWESKSNEIGASKYHCLRALADLFAAGVLRGNVT